MGNKNLVNAMIKRNGTGKSIDTKLELEVANIITRIGFVVEHPEITFKAHGVWVKDPEDGRLYLLKPDHHVVDTDVMVQTDGPHHDTLKMKNKGLWEDGLLNEHTLDGKRWRVIHVPHQLIWFVDKNIRNPREFHPRIAFAIAYFLVSKDPICWLDP